MTPFSKVYTAFLARILEDEWQQWMYEEAEQDWRQLMENALTWFKFPRVSLEHDENGFIDDVNGWAFVLLFYIVSLIVCAMSETKELFFSCSLFHTPVMKTGQAGCSTDRRPSKCRRLSETRHK